MKNEPLYPNFKDIKIDKLTKEEEDLIRFFRNMTGQHGEFYSERQLIFTDGVATTWINSEDSVFIDILSKVVHWDDDSYINHLRKKTYERKSELKFSDFGEFQKFAQYANSKNPATDKIQRMLKEHSSIPRRKKQDDEDNPIEVEKHRVHFENKTIQQRLNIANENIDRNSDEIWEQAEKNLAKLKGDKNK